MNATSSSCAYRLVIRNLTLHDLALASKQIVHGVWFREGEDGGLPVGVPAGATVEAMGIRASIKNGKDCECRCAWEVANGAGRIALFVSVPLIGGRNRSGLDVSGGLKVGGWTGLPVIGHNFRHEIAVSYAL